MGNTNTYISSAYRKCASCCIPIYLIRRRSASGKGGKEVYQNLNISGSDSSKPVPSTLEIGGINAAGNQLGVDAYNDNMVLSPEKMAEEGLRQANDAELKIIDRLNEDISIELPNLKEEEYFNNNVEHEWIKLGKISLEQVKEKINSSYEGFELLLNDENSEQKIKIYAREYVTDKKHRVNVYRSEYIMPCSPEQYIQFMNNIEEQRKLDSKIDSYFIDETFGENYFLIFLQYKKMLVFSSRFFVYIKHFEKLAGDDKIWIDVSKSVEVEKYQDSKDKVKGEISLGGSIVEEIVVEGKVFCKVRTYSEMDFKFSISVPKGVSSKEMKNYIETCGKKLKEFSNALQL